MTSDSEPVLGVPRSLIMRGDSWLGVRDRDIEGVLGLIETRGEYRPRDLAEHDPTFKQVIPYLLLRDGERVFLMKRSRAGGDARLYDRWSIGIGGHLDPDDGSVLDGLRREFEEEMIADWRPEARLVGLLNDDRDLVGQVHLGVVFVAEAKGRSIEVRETHKLSGGFAPLDEVRRIYDGLETWSQHVFDYLQEREEGGVVHVADARSMG